MGKKKKKEEKPFFSNKSRRVIAGLLLFLISVIGFLSAFEEMAGEGGDLLKALFTWLFGGISILVPLLLFVVGLIFFKTEYERIVLPIIGGFLMILFGVVGFFSTFSTFFENIEDKRWVGGVMGRAISNPMENLLGVPATLMVFVIFTVIGMIIFWELLYKEASFVEVVEGFFSGRKKKKESRPSVIKKIFSTNFKTEKIEEKKEEEKDDQEKEEEKKGSKEEKRILPPVKLLDKGGGTADPGDTKKSAEIIKNTFLNFDIDVKMSEINIGPTVTQYTLKPAEGVRLSKITSLSEDLALALAKHPVRTEAPIPGKSLVGIEVPNEDREMIKLRDLLSNKFYKHDSDLTLAVGKDVSGSLVFSDMARMPHLLVAGATGSGKTIFLNTLILSLIYKNSPEDLRLILVDPKRVEFSLYKRLPHLLTSVIYDAEKTYNALEWLIGEMERRFDVLAQNKKRNIVSYNKYVEKEDDKEKLPYIVLIIDELADLMAKKQSEIEGGIVRIAQMARAVGIHLILATQRPSVEVITGLIKANITSRVSFQVASQVDSRTILDMGGAERLLGAGDMLFVSSNSSKPRRVQGPYVSEEEVKSIVNWLVDKSEDESQDDDLSDDLEEELDKSHEERLDEDEEEDDLYEEAKELVIMADKASASMLQRKLRIGYVRAARILDMLERRNVVGPSRGSKPRVVYGDSNEEEQDNNKEDFFEEENIN